MDRLEIGIYSKQFVAGIVGVELTDSHFSRKVQTTLTKWGYSYKYSRKQIEITAIPTTPEEKLNEMLIRQLNIDVQIDIGKFATFVFLLLDDKEFASMPMGERAEILKTQYKIDVSEITLKRWYKKLVDNEIVISDNSEKTYWCSMYVGGVKSRLKVEKDFQGRIEYEKYKKELIDLNMKNEKSFAEAHSIASMACWHKFKCCYYSCNTVVFNAFFMELLELVEEVFDNCDCDYAITSVCHLERIPRLDF